MKKNILKSAISFFALSIGFVNAQTTNTFPTNGNVGIGTTTPLSYKLQVVGNMTSTWGDFFNNTGDTYDYGVVRIGRNANDMWHMGQMISTNSIANNSFRISRRTNANTWIDGICINPTGNVGIGTASTNYKFEVVGNSKITQLDLASLNVTQNARITQLEVYQPANVYDAGFLRLGTDIANQWHLRYRGTGNAPTQGDFQIIGANGGTWFSALGINKTSGRVYIGSDLDVAGTTAAASCAALKLYVDGTIGSKEVRVSTTAWCDYVFDKTYKLKPLKEVEKYIQSFKHLPEVPSEQQVVADGIAVSEMMKIHMKKIEELTLYMIELQKQNEKLATEIAGLKK